MNNKLTHAQENFITYILEGLSQYAAYQKAYPKSQNWTRNTADSRASKLFKSYKIYKRYLDRLEILNEQTNTKLLWTREKAVANLLAIIENATQEQNRIDAAYENEITILREKLKHTKGKAARREVELQIIQAEMQRRVCPICNRAILRAIEILNRMHNLYSQNIEIDTVNITFNENLASYIDEVLKK